jgi:putative tryptophan/tyrosine transport system substrate-binding protein
MRRLANLALRLLVFFSVPLSPQAQPAKDAPHIGYLGSSSASSDQARTQAFRRGLGELGYVEGRNIVVEWRYPEGQAEKLTDLAAYFARRKVQVIVVSGATATAAVKKQAGTIPIVMTNVSDPVGLGLVESLGRPGGTITGLTNISPELGAKRLELLKEIVPGVARVAVLGDPGSPAYGPQIKELQAAATPARLQLYLMEIRQAADLDKAFAAIAEARVDAVMALQNPTITRLRARLAELAAQARLPAMYPQGEFVEAGGLISYGPDIPDLHRQAAYFVDRILKGAKPADLPVEQPRKYELAINILAAKKIGLTIPAQVLFRADKTIK